MQAQVGVVVAMAAFDPHVVADLPTDAVAMVVPRHEVAKREPGTVLAENAAGVVAVEMFVLRSVPVEGEVLDRSRRKSLRR